MNRLPRLALILAIIALTFSLLADRTPAQETPPAAPPQGQAEKPANTPSGEKDAKKAGGDEGNPFAPEPAPPMPPGMTGSDVNDPRYKLAPGLYDAGETSMGLEHLLLVKKPDAFQLGSSDPDDPKVEKVLGQLGIGNPKKMPKPMHLVIAQLAFANSDLAFQGSHLFQGNFYGISIYDIADPAKTKLLTTLVCPGGQGDVSVYKNLLFMSVEMPNGRLDCGSQGFPPEPPPPDEEKDQNKEKAKDSDQAKNSDQDK